MGLLVDVRPELPALHDLHQDEQLVPRLVRADLLEDKRVLALGENVLLVHDVSLLVRAHDLALGHGLESAHPPRRLVLSQLHPAEGARADGGEHVELLERDLRRRPPPARAAAAARGHLLPTEHLLLEGLILRRQQQLEEGRPLQNQALHLAHRLDGGLARLLPDERPLPEVLLVRKPGDLHLGAAVVLGDGHLAVVDDVEALPLLALLDDHLPRPEALHAHRVRDLDELVVGEHGEQGNALQNPDAHLLRQGLGDFVHPAQDQHEVLTRQDEARHWASKGDAVGVPRFVEHERHLAEVVAGLARDEVDLRPALLGRRALHISVGDDVKLVPLFALRDDVLALPEGLLHERARHLVHHLVVQRRQELHLFDELALGHKAR
mmetsp:Transcript_19752/g.44794  ORF Transcript_19752/g.44794 Transcript_19752/m.44794 type:complete len:380 (+) Transcript_19752:1149-2288(+)